MTALNAWVALLSTLIGWLVLRGLDRFVATWMATLTIAWEISATASARKAYSQKLNELRLKFRGKAAQWETWREQAAPGKDS